MKPKIGHCIDCHDGSPKKPLTAKRCEFHYRKHRAEVCAAKAKNKAKRAKKAELTVFFASQLLETPNRCENCGADIQFWKRVNPRILVAHILPKREVGGFPQVSTHPLNRVFLCPDCHTNFDNKGEAFALTMPALPIIKERFNGFKNLLTISDLQRIPNYLK